MIRRQPLGVSGNDHEKSGQEGESSSLGESSRLNRELCMREGREGGGGGLMAEGVMYRGFGELSCLLGRGKRILQDVVARASKAGLTGRALLGEKTRRKTRVVTNGCEGRSDRKVRSAAGKVVGIPSG